MGKHVLVILIVALAIAAPLLCVAAEHLSAPSAGDGSVVLVEHLSQCRGWLINGTYPATTLAGKDYLYDAGRKLLDAGGIRVNDTLRVVLGVSESLSQDAGSGAAGDAYGIYRLPSIVEGIAIDSLAPDGTVTLAYNGSTIVLSPGERWETISTDTVCTPDYSIRFMRSDAIKNDGFLAKSSIS